MHGIAVIAAGAMFASSSASVAIASGFSRQDIPSAVSMPLGADVIAGEGDRDLLKGSPEVVWSELIKRIRERPENTQRDPVDLDQFI